MQGEGCVCVQGEGCVFKTHLSMYAKVHSQHEHTTVEPPIRDPLR